MLNIQGLVCERPGCDLFAVVNEDLFDPPPGCRFHTRCHKRFDRCDKDEPVLREVEPRHWVSCYLY